MRLALLTAIFTAALVPAAPASAQVDAICMKAWNETVEVELIGKRCNWLDAARANALGALQSRQSACFTANQKPEVAQQNTALQQETRAKLQQKFTTMECSAAARGYFDKKYQELVVAR